MTSSSLLSGLYLVTPDWDDTEQLLSGSELALQAGARILQYRHKTADAALRRHQASALQQLCRRYDCLFIINDHIELCLELDADGLHVGGTDIAVETARRQLGPEKIVGASCYGDLTLAQRAEQQGASYVAFGGFYPSRVKKYPVTTPINLLATARAQVKLPQVVIGGMTQSNCQPLIAAGADMVAAISSVYMADNIALATREFLALFPASSQRR